MSETPESPENSPIAATAETDAVLVDGMPEPSEWSGHYLKLTRHARRMERERNTARIPICIGRPIIEILAEEGMWRSMNGNSVVAADCLFQKNPYAAKPDCPKAHWTKDLPTEDGSYWYREEGAAPEIVMWHRRLGWMYHIGASTPRGNDIGLVPIVGEFWSEKLTPPQ